MIFNITGIETVEKLEDGTYNVKSTIDTVMPIESLDIQINGLSAEIIKLTARKNELIALKEKFLSAKTVVKL